MDEVATVAVRAEAVLEESAASFCLVLGVCLLVLLEFVESMRELALFLVGTVAVLHELFAELRFFLMDGRRNLGREVLARRLLG